MHRKILFLVFVIITFLFLMRVGHFLFNREDVTRVLVLDEGWDVRYNETEYENVSLSELRGIIGHDTKKGDVIRLSRQMSGYGIYHDPALCFETRFSGYKVWFNGDMLFGQWYEPEYQNKFVGCKNIYATLPRSYAPTTIAIELFVTQDGAYSYFEPVIFGNFRDISLYIIYYHLFILMISAFLIVFGLLFFVIAVGFRTTYGEFRIQSYGSLLFVTLGIWFLSQFKMLDLFIETYGHQTEIEYISLYLSAPLMFMVIGCVNDHMHNKYFIAFAVIGIAVAILPIVLHYTGIQYINKSLFMFQIVGFILLAYLIYLLVTDHKGGKMTTSQYVQLVGQMILALSFVFNVIFYFLERLGLSEQILLSKVAVPVGALLMAFTMLVNYCIYIAESYAHQKEYKSLAHLAYADGLTNLPNRSRYEKYVDDLNHTTEDYCIISIDLNHLKTVNDSGGHLMGDKYILEFSDALRECFKDMGFVARIGGDEFVAVLKGNVLNMPTTYIKMLNAALEKKNAEDPSIKRSAATGFAYRHEVDDDNWNSVYLLADERMYETKAEMHAAM